MWGGWLEFLAYVKAYKDLIVVGALFVTGVSLFFVGRRLRATMVEVREQYDQIESKFKSAVETAVGNLKRQLESTLDEAVENSGDALAKRMESLRGGLITQIDEALAKFGFNPDPEKGVDAGDEAERWAEIQTIWNITKNEIDERLSDALTRVTNGRQRRRYDNLNRSNYENIILQLFEDRWLGSKETDAGLEMNNIFNSKRNRRSPVNHYDVSHFKELRQQWERFRDRRKKAGS